MDMFYIEHPKYLFFLKVTNIFSKNMVKFKTCFQLWEYKKKLVLILTKPG
jgi:hypothetical protein